MPPGFLCLLRAAREVRRERKSWAPAGRLRLVVPVNPDGQPAKQINRLRRECLAEHLALELQHFQRRSLVFGNVRVQRLVTDEEIEPLDLLELPARNWLILVCPDSRGRFLGGFGLGLWLLGI